MCTIRIPIRASDMYPVSRPIQKYPLQYPNAHDIMQGLISRWCRTKQTTKGPIPATIAPIRCSQPQSEAVEPIQDTMPPTRHRLSQLEHRNVALSIPRSQRKHPYPRMLSPTWPARYTFRRYGVLKGPGTVEKMISPTTVEAVYEQSPEYDLPTLLVTKPDGCCCAVKVIRQRTNWLSMADELMDFDTSDDDDTEGEDEQLLYDTESEDSESEDEKDCASELDENYEDDQKGLYPLRRTSSRRMLN